MVVITGKPPAHSTPCLPSVVTQFYYREKTATKIREDPGAPAGAVNGALSVGGGGEW